MATQKTTKKEQERPQKAPDAAKPDFMPTVRELARAYQAFTTYSDRHIRTLGLTSPQFDVVATLGGTKGMTMGEVAEKTLVTKGTLTGIIDRLVEKNLVRREVPEDNRRCCNVMLTEAGDRLYQEIFPAHIAHLGQRLDQLEPTDLEQLRLLLKKLREVL